MYMYVYVCVGGWWGRSRGILSIPVADTIFGTKSR